ncbi:hypothetical protein JCM13304A_13540 [Desulfothermus okinawensis JCM 13304]
MQDIGYIPLSQDLIMIINCLKKDDETMQDFLRRLIENFIFQRDMEQAQMEKMRELWDNEEDMIWEKMI